MAVVEYRVNELAEEQTLMRTRIHELSGDRGTIHLIVDQMKTLVENMEEVAERVAQKTVAAMLEQRAAANRGWREEAMGFAKFGIAAAALFLGLHFH